MPGAFVDIIYDHFLANDAYEFEEGALANFAQNTYVQLESYEKWLPEKFQRLLFLHANAKLAFKLPINRRHTQQFQGLCRRAKYIDDPEPVFEAFLDTL